jgi:hypothetical protein
MSTARQFDNLQFRAEPNCAFFKRAKNGSIETKAQETGTGSEVQLHL